MATENKNVTDNVDFVTEIINIVGVEKADAIMKEIAKSPMADVDNLKIVNAEFKSHIEYLTRENERLKGEIKGLRFAIRCNGVSGNEVTE